jgi:hypothetical protein
VPARLARPRPVWRVWNCNLQNPIRKLRVFFVALRADYGHSAGRSDPRQWRDGRAAVQMDYLTPECRTWVQSSFRGLEGGFHAAAGTEPAKESAMTTSTILLIVLVILLVGALPAWPYSRSWGYAPGGTLGTIVLILLILLLLGYV